MMTTNPRAALLRELELLAIAVAGLRNADQAGNAMLFTAKLAAIGRRLIEIDGKYQELTTVPALKTEG